MNWMIQVDLVQIFNDQSTGKLVESVYMWAICDIQIDWINIDHDWGICALVSIVYTWATYGTQAD